MPKGISTNVYTYNELHFGGGGEALLALCMRLPFGHWHRKDDGHYCVVYGTLSSLAVVRKRRRLGQRKRSQSAYLAVSVIRRERGGGCAREFDLGGGYALYAVL